MKKKFQDRQILIDLLQNYLKETKSKQTPSFTNYTTDELIKCFYLYKIPLPIIP
jgi:hypothetical protein